MSIRQKKPLCPPGTHLESNPFKINWLKFVAFRGAWMVKESLRGPRFDVVANPETSWKRLPGPLLGPQCSRRFTGFHPPPI